MVNIESIHDARSEKYQVMALGLNQPLTEITKISPLEGVKAAGAYG